MEESTNAIVLEEGQSYAEYLRAAAIKGKYETVKRTADAYVAECVKHAASVGSYKHTISLDAPMDPDIIEYMQSHGLNVTAVHSMFESKYRYAIDYAVPEEPIKSDEPAESDESADCGQESGN